MKTEKETKKTKEKKTRQKMKSNFHEKKICKHKKKENRERSKENQRKSQEIPWETNKMVQPASCLDANPNERLANDLKKRKRACPLPPEKLHPRGV